jgi:hypothetical protein
MAVGVIVCWTTSTVVVVLFAFVTVEVLKMHKVSKSVDGSVLRGGTTDVVTCVTVAMKYEEQSAVPYLVVKAEALTAES